MSATHSHNLIDSDPHFSIDPVTRTIVNETSKKVSLLQYDHNSERFSFEVDRYIEGHDMSNSTIQIHYINTGSSSRTKILGMYEVSDSEVDPDDDQKVRFSWLISENVTHQAGVLSFIITFYCEENDNVVYRWSAGPNNTITIAAGMNNGEVIIETYPDVLLKWKKDIYEHIYRCEKNIDSAIESNVSLFKEEMREYVNGCVIEPTEFATTEEVKNIFG